MNEELKKIIEDAAIKHNGYSLYCQSSKAPIFNEGFAVGAEWGLNNADRVQPSSAEIINSSRIVAIKEMREYCRSLREDENNYIYKENALAIDCAIMSCIEILENCIERVYKEKGDNMERIPTGVNEGQTIKVKINSVDKLRPSELEDLHEHCGNKIDWESLREDFFNECTNQFNGIAPISISSHDVFEWFKNKISA